MSVRLTHMLLKNKRVHRQLPLRPVPRTVSTSVACSRGACSRSAFRQRRHGRHAPPGPAAGLRRGSRSPLALSEAAVLAYLIQRPLVIYRGTTGHQEPPPATLLGRHLCLSSWPQAEMKGEAVTGLTAPVLGFFFSHF